MFFRKFFSYVFFILLFIFNIKTINAVNFGYTGAVQTYTVPAWGYYTLEVWGAQGGGGPYGGYSTGVVQLNAGTVLYIVVGGTTSTTSGGYNGGGSTPTGAYGGGGATHIATTTGLLSTLSSTSNREKVLIVAGGGGGNSACCGGGAGGGYVGNNGVGTSYWTAKYASGGNQTSGGCNVALGTACGSFGLGSNSTGNNGGGAGGGWYGGGGGTWGVENSGGGGGSGYIANSLLLTYSSVTKRMYCYSCSTSTTNSIRTYSTTTASTTPTTNYPKAGSGYAKINLLLGDTTAPVCGTWSPTSSPWKTSGTQAFTLSGSTDTGGSGISTAGGSCTTGSTNGATCTVTISDVAGNTRVCTSPVNRVDATAPECGTWSPTSSPWKNSGASTFTLSGSTDTGGSGISTAGGSCTTGSTNGATCTVTISDVAGNTRVCTSPANNIDAVAPSGGSISYSATTITSSTQSLSITVADGTDSLAGINTDTRQLLRQEAIYDGSSCGSYGNPYPVSYSGTYPNITTSNFDLNRCYKYFWRIADNANNNTFYSSSTVVTATNANLSLQTRTLGSIITINNLPFIKVTETGLLVALEEHPFVTTTTFSYTGAAQTFTVPRSGWYQIEAWGAAGGDARIVNGALVPNSGGQGGYTSGKIYLTAGTVLTIQVGGKGGDQDSTVAQSYGAGGYNGGGNGGTELNTETSPEAGAGGGGATDIRLVGGSWNDITSLRSRIMVTAGGGGAASHISGATYPEAYGGSAATLVGSSISSLTTGGTQISGGAFGIGKAGFSDSSGSNYGAYGGGGGGYYGGSWSTNNSSSVAHGGASGSSFISGYAGVNTVTSASSTTATYTTLHYSNQYFRDSIIKGEERSGNGQAKISYLGNSLIRINNNLNNVRYIKDCVNENSVNTANQWSEIQAIKNGINLAKEKLVIGSSLIHSSTNSRDYATIVNGLIWSSGTDLAQSSGGGLQCVTVDLGQTYDLDEIAVWHYSLDGRTYNDNVTYVSTNNSTWTTVISITEPETANGKRVSAYRNSINMTNQVNNGRFNSSTVTGWSTSGTSVTNTVNGTISPLGLYINDTSSTGGFWNYYATSLVSGNIYYAAQKIYINSQSAGGISIGFRDSTGAFVSSYSPSSSNGFERVSRRVAAGSNWTHLQVGTAGAAIVSGYIKEVMLINLTAVFGAGNEPTQEWCDENIPFFEGTALIYYP